MATNSGCRARHCTRSARGIGMRKTRPCPGVAHRPGEEMAPKQTSIWSEEDLSTQAPCLWGCPLTLQQHLQWPDTLGYMHSADGDLSSSVTNNVFETWFSSFFEKSTFNRNPYPALPHIFPPLTPKSSAQLLEFSPGTQHSTSKWAFSST